MEARSQSISQAIVSDRGNVGRFVILHLNCAFEANRAGVVAPIERMERDIRDLFRLPIPGRVWREYKTYQNPAFIAFVEKAVGQHIGVKPHW